MKPQIPVWVLTDPEGKDNTVLLGAQMFNGWCFRSWAQIEGMQAITDNIKYMISTHKKKAALPDAQVKQIFKYICCCLCFCILIVLLG